MKDYMSKPENNLGKFLQANSNKSNEELAESIREAKKLNNKHTQVVLHQERKSICSTAEKLLKAVKCYDDKAELIIKIKKQTWKQD
jgi:ActR/RegA family two-component response regulator